MPDYDSGPEHNSSWIEIAPKSQIPGWVSRPRTNQQPQVFYRHYCRRSISGLLGVGGSSTASEIISRALVRPYIDAKRNTIKPTSRDRFSQTQLAPYFLTNSITKSRCCFRSRCSSTRFCTNRPQSSNGSFHPIGNGVLKMVFMADLTWIKRSI